MQLALRVTVALLVTSLVIYNIASPGSATEKVAAGMFWVSLLLFGATIVARTWGPWKDPE